MFLCFKPYCSLVRWSLLTHRHTHSPVPGAKMSSRRQLICIRPPRCQRWETKRPRRCLLTESITASTVTPIPHQSLIMTRSLPQRKAPELLWDWQRGFGSFFSYWLHTANNCLWLSRIGYKNHVIIFYLHGKCNLNECEWMNENAALLTVYLLWPLG